MAALSLLPSSANQVCFPKGHMQFCSAWGSRAESLTITRVDCGCLWVPESFGTRHITKGWKVGFQLAIYKPFRSR